MSVEIKILRALILTNWGIFVTRIAFPAMFDSTLPPALSSFQFEPTTAGAIVALVLFALWAVSTIGIFFLWRPARILYTAFVLGGAVLAPLFGPLVLGAVDRSFEEIQLILSGSILALLYWSRLQDHFRNPSAIAT